MICRKASSTLTSVHSVSVVAVNENARERGYVKLTSRDGRYVLWHCQLQFVDDVGQNHRKGSRELLPDHVDMVRILNRVAVDDVPELHILFPVDLVSNEEHGDEGLRILTSSTDSANETSSSGLRLISSNTSGPETNTIHLSNMGTLKALP